MSSAPFSFAIGDLKFLIRSFSPTLDCLEAYRQLFLRCDNVIVAGIEQDNEDLRRVGEEYVRQACQSDLKSGDSVKAVYQHGAGDFWVLLLVPPADSGSNTSTIIGSIGKSSQYVNI
jgi:hypothetical protein